MYQSPEQLLSINKSNVEAAMRLAGITLQSVEKACDLQIAAAKTALAEGASSVRALVHAREPKDVASVHDRAIQPSLRAAQAYARGLYGLAASTHNELSKMFEAQVAEFNKSAAAALEKAASHAPSGAEFAFSALRSAVTGANVAFDNMSQVARQMAEIGAANVAAATRSQGGKKAV